jgi:hypothetical protein
MEDPLTLNLPTVLADLVARVTRLEEALDLPKTDEGASPVEDSPSADSAAQDEAAQDEAAQDEAAQDEAAQDERIASLQSRNTRLLADYERIEGEYQALKLKVELGQGARPASSAAPGPSDAAQQERIAALQSRNARLQANSERIEAEFQAFKLEVDLANSALPGDDGERGRSEALEKEVAELRAECERVKAEKAGLEAGQAAAAQGGDHASSKVELGTLRFQVAKLTTDLERAAEKHQRELTERAASGGGSETERLRAEKEALKDRATRTIKRLKEEVDTTKLQKTNLLKQLANRDAGAPQQTEITLEQITDSPVFKTMLGNIRRTSREEVTLLHDSIVEFGKVSPQAYNDLLVMIDARFKAAVVENPLALLPKLETP